MINSKIGVGPLGPARRRAPIPLPLRLRILLPLRLAPPALPILMLIKRVSMRFSPNSPIALMFHAIYLDKSIRTKPVFKTFLNGVRIGNGPLGPGRCRLLALLLAEPNPILTLIKRASTSFFLLIVRPFLTMRVKLKFTALCRMLANVLGSMIMKRFPTNGEGYSLNPNVAFILDVHQTEPLSVICYSHVRIATAASSSRCLCPFFP